MASGNIRAKHMKIQRPKSGNASLGEFSDTSKSNVEGN